MSGQDAILSSDGNGRTPLGNNNCYDPNKGVVGAPRYSCNKAFKIKNNRTEIIGKENLPLNIDDVAKEKHPSRVDSVAKEIRPLSTHKDKRGLPENADVSPITPDEQRLKKRLYMRDYRQRTREQETQSVQLGAYSFPGSLEASMVPDTIDQISVSNKDTDAPQMSTVSDEKCLKRRQYMRDYRERIREQGTQKGPLGASNSSVTGSSAQTHELDNHKDGEILDLTPQSHRLNIYNDGEILDLTQQSHRLNTHNDGEILDLTLGSAVTEPEHTSYDGNTSRMCEMDSVGKETNTLRTQSVKRGRPKSINASPITAEEQRLKRNKYMREYRQRKREDTVEGNLIELQNRKREIKNIKNQKQNYPRMRTKQNKDLVGGNAPRQWLSGANL